MPVWLGTPLSVITRPFSCQTAEILGCSVSFVLSKYRDSLLWTRTGLRLIWFPGCDPPAASVFVFLSHIGKDGGLRPKSLVTSLCFWSGLGYCTFLWTSVAVCLLSVVA